MVRPFIVFGFEMHGDHIFVFSRPERVASQALGKLVAPRDCGPVGFRNIHAQSPREATWGAEHGNAFICFGIGMKNGSLGLGGDGPPSPKGFDHGVFPSGF